MEEKCIKIRQKAEEDQLKKLDEYEQHQNKVTERYQDRLKLYFDRYL